jgi:hypothetical protein
VPALLNSFSHTAFARPPLYASSLSRPYLRSYALWYAIVPRLP